VSKQEPYSCTIGESDLRSRKSHAWPFASAVTDSDIDAIVVAYVFVEQSHTFSYHCTVYVSKQNANFGAYIC